MTKYTGPGIAFVATQWSLILIALLFVSIRLYSRIFLTRSVGSDDFAIAITISLILTASSFDTIAFKNGFARHQNTLSHAEYTKFEEAEYISYTIVYLVYFFLRNSVMLFVLRLLPVYKKWQRKVIYLVLIINLAITILACVTYGISCIPFKANWEEIPNSKCLSKNVLVITNLVNASLACVCDVITAIIPQMLLFRVQMKPRTKHILNFFFSLGLITAGISIGRAATITRKTLTQDTTWNMIPSYFLSGFESKLGVIAACCPALRQFFTYTQRTHTLLPSDRRQYPNEDFVKMRWRINWRDVLWYSNAPMVGSRVFEASTFRGRNTSREAMPSRGYRREEVEKSALDKWQDRFKQPFSSRKRSDTSGSSPLRHDDSQRAAKEQQSERDVSQRYRQWGLGSPRKEPPAQTRSAPSTFFITQSRNRSEDEGARRPSEDVEFGEALARGYVHR